MSRRKPRQRWYTIKLLSVARQWCRDLRQRRKYTSEHNTSWWHFISDTRTKLPQWVDNFVEGCHRFSPMKTYYLPNEIAQVWD